MPTSTNTFAILLRILLDKHCEHRFFSSLSVLSPLPFSYLAARFLLTVAFASGYPLPFSSVFGYSPRRKRDLSSTTPAPSFCSFSLRFSRCSAFHESHRKSQRKGLEKGLAKVRRRTFVDHRGIVNFCLRLTFLLHSEIRSILVNDFSGK